MATKYLLNEEYVGESIAAMLAVVLPGRDAARDVQQDIAMMLHPYIRAHAVTPFRSSLNLCLLWLQLTARDCLGAPAVRTIFDSLWELIDYLDDEVGRTSFINNATGGRVASDILIRVVKVNAALAAVVDLANRTLPALNPFEQFLPSASKSVPPQEYARVVASNIREQLAVEAPLLTITEVTAELRRQGHGEVRVYDIVQIWRKLECRPNAGAGDPQETDQRYCKYDKARRNYVYTKAFVERAARELSAVKVKGTVSMSVLVGK
jgi:hypothetical protein